ncbi:MAG: hypothetical protein AAB421_00585 [Patescibacteria group bacterium]
MTKRLFFAGTSILVLTLAVHLYAQTGKLYWQVWWLDIPMHYFGGIGAGFFGLWFASLLGVLPRTGDASSTLWGVEIRFPQGVPRWWSLLWTLIAVAIIGIGWEMLEVFLLAYFDKPIPFGYIEDTLKDLVMDTLGATTAWAAFHRVQWQAWLLREAH